MDFSGYLIVTDLDGTLFNREQKVPERSIRAIEYFKNNGGHFTFATGRAKMFIDTRFAFLKPLVNAPVILSNGSRIYDYSSEKTIFSTAFDKTDISSLLKKVHSEIPDLPIEIYTRDCVYVINPNERLYKRFSELSQYAHFCDFFEIPNEDIIRIAIVDTDRERIAKASKFITDNSQGLSVELVFSDWFIFEILPHGATKGNGIGKLRNILGNVKVISAGDWNNDISQLKVADIALCPLNANETVKSICNHVLCDCDEGLIADIVEYIEKGLFDIN